MIWKIYRQPDKSWCQIIQNKYLDNIDSSRILTIANLEGGSAVWEFLSKCRHVIMNHLSWRLGNGRRALFWTNSWGGHQSLSKMTVLGNYVERLQEDFGCKVVDYVIFEPNVIGGQYKWKAVDTWPLPSEIKSTVERELVFQLVNLSNREDMIIWCGATSGEYLAKLGYQIQVAQCEEKSWLVTLCWKWEVLPKVGAFLWVSSYKRCLTGGRLKRLGIVSPSR